MAITIDGVTYRNLPEQVEKNKTDIETLKANIEGIKKNAFTDVDTAEYPTLEDFLQSTGEEGIIYLYPDGTNFKQYIWEGDEWRFIGDTELDITNMVTTDTDQTISGQKTFSKTMRIPAANDGGRYEIGSMNGYYLTFDHYTSSNARDGTPLNIIYGTRIDTYHIRPSTNNIYDIGSTDAKYKNLYLGGNAYITNLDNDSGTFIFNGNVRPKTGGNRSLGNSTYKWKDLYLSGNLSDGTNSVRVAEIGKTKLYKHTFTNVTPPQDVSQNTLFVIDNDPTQILLTTNINGIRLSNALKIGMPSGTNKIYAFGLQTGLFTITGYILGSTASTFDFTGATEEITEY